MSSLHSSQATLEKTPNLPQHCGYRKPFNLYYFNRPKLPPLKPPKKVIGWRESPNIPVRYNIATRMRDKIIKDYNTHDPEYPTYRAKINWEKVLKNQYSKPVQTKTSRYRYIFRRDIPVVSCRFTEHLMTYRRPPFVNEKNPPSSPNPPCAYFKIRYTLLQKESIKKQIEKNEDKKHEILK